MQWYCHIGGQQYGPVDEQEMIKWIQEGRLTASDIVWAEGMADWQRCDQTEPFASQFSTGGGELHGTNGQTENRDLTAKARSILTGQWGRMALFTLGYIFTMGILTGLRYTIHIDGDKIPINYGNLIFGGVASFGCAILYLALSRSQEINFAMFFSGFKYFGKLLLLNFLITIFILLWTLLFIIPGIIAIFSYAMAFYIMADNPDMAPLDAIKTSKKMMYGHRWKLFCLGLRFLGWAILCILTLGIGFLWFTPYTSTSVALFYQDIQPAAGAATPPEIEPVETIETTLKE